MEDFWKDTQEIGCLGKRNERNLNLLSNPFGPLEFYNMYMYYLHKKKMFNAKKIFKMSSDGKKTYRGFSSPNCKLCTNVYLLCLPRPHQKDVKRIKMI